MHTLTSLMKSDLVQALEEAIVEHKDQLNDIKGNMSQSIINISRASNKDNLMVEKAQVMAAPQVRAPVQRNVNNMKQKPQASSFQMNEMRNKVSQHDYQPIFEGQRAQEEQGELFN